MVRLGSPLPAISPLWGPEAVGWLPRVLMAEAMAVRDLPPVFSFSH